MKSINGIFLVAAFLSLWFHTSGLAMAHRSTPNQISSVGSRSPSKFVQQDPVSIALSDICTNKPTQCTRDNGVHWLEHRITRDSAPTAPQLVVITINDVEVTEGDVAVFTIQASGFNVLQNRAYVTYSTVNKTAQYPTDYLFTQNTVELTSSSPSTKISVPTVQDPLNENTEYFMVTLSSSDVLTQISRNGMGIIVDNDPPPNLRISDATVIEGDTAVFTVTLDAPSGRTVTVEYTTSDGTATADTDYTAASERLTFAAGVTTQTVSITTTQDTLDEADETFTVTLSNATIADAVGSATIVDDDVTIIYLPLVLH